MSKKVNGRWKFSERDFHLGPMSLGVWCKTLGEARAWVRENSRRCDKGIGGLALRGVTVNDIARFPNPDGKGTGYIVWV